jgi:hypothetical protein
MPYSIPWSVHFEPGQGDRRTGDLLVLREDHPLQMIGGASAVSDDHTSTYTITSADGTVANSPPLAESYTGIGQQVFVTVRRTYPGAQAEDVYGSVTVDPDCQESAVDALKKLISEKK